MKENDKTKKKYVTPSIRVIRIDPPSMICAGSGVRPDGSIPSYNPDESYNAGDIFFGEDDNDNGSAAKQGFWMEEKN